MAASRKFYSREQAKIESHDPSMPGLFASPVFLLRSNCGSIDISTQQSFNAINLDRVTKSGSLPLPPSVFGYFVEIYFQYSFHRAPSLFTHIPCDSECTCDSTLFFDCMSIVFRVPKVCIFVAGFEKLKQIGFMC